MATNVQQSIVLDAPIERVWSLIRPLDFAYLKQVAGVVIESKASSSEVGPIRVVNYADKTVQHIKLTHLSDLNFSIGWDVISSDPPIQVLSISHSVRLYRVTTSSSTFVEWTTHFSKDVSTAVLEDCRYKQQDHFNGLRTALLQLKSVAAPVAAPIAAVAGVTFDWEGQGPREVLTAERVRQLTEPLAKAIAEGKAQQGAFNRIRLSGKSFGIDAAREMAVTLSQLRGVTAFDISDTIARRLQEEVCATIDTLCAAVAQNQLLELNVSDNALGAPGAKSLEKAIRGQKQLRTFISNNCGLQGTAAKFYADTILANGAPTNLRHFEIHNNLLEDAGSLALAPLFANSPNLERIRFSTTRLSKVGGAALVQSLIDGKSTSFVSIDISDNSIGPEAALKLADQLVAKQPKLEQLHLADTGLGSKGVIALIAALSQPGNATNLRSLDLSNLDIDAKVASKLADMIRTKPHLQRLVLEGNDIGSSGAIAIAKALADHKEIKELNLASNSITAKAAAAIVQMLKPSFAKLNLNANRISKAGVVLIKSRLKDLNKPSILDPMSDNDEDGDEDDDEAQSDGEDDSKLAGDMKKLSVGK